jgi:integrase
LAKTKTTILSTATTTTTKSLLEKKIADIVSETYPYVKTHLLATGTNIETIIDYIFSLKIEVSCSPNYKENTICTLYRLSKFYANKPFKVMSRDDITKYLDSLRKTETQDPLHKWVGTYNLYLVHLLRFFKWLYSPRLEPKMRSRPEVMENIPKLKRKETSIYKPSDIWTPADDLLFLKYCPSKRDKFYHAISRDSSARPHEILKLKIRDISFKTVGNSQYSEVVVNGKTGTRSIPLINSLPYLKDYLDHVHPQPGNPNSPLICGEGKSLGKHISPQNYHKIYDCYHKQIFPKLLDSPNVLPEDKPKIRELLKKPWNPYIRRHSAATEKAQLLKEPILKMHCGWSPRSQTHLKYQHWFGNESNESLLRAYGLVDDGIQIDQLRPKQCPNCQEPNKIDSKFCAKCRMVLTYDAYNETLDNQKEKEDDLNTLKRQMHVLLSALGTMDQSSKNDWAKRMVKEGIYKRQVVQS